MHHSLKKSKTCLGGFDDGYFERNWQKTVAVLALHDYTTLHPHTAIMTTITVDGGDAVEALEELVERAKEYCDSIKAVFLDTIVYAGFNILDPWKALERLQIPLIIVYTYFPDVNAIETALRKHFDDWRQRLKPILEVVSRLRKASCPRGTIYIASYGIEYSDAWHLTCRAQLYSRQPEPLYTSNKLASKIARRLVARLKNPSPNSTTLVWLGR